MGEELRLREAEQVPQGHRAGRQQSTTFASGQPSQAAAQGAIRSLVFPCTGVLQNALLASSFLLSPDELTMEVTDLRTKMSDLGTLQELSGL